MTQVVLDHFYTDLDHFSHDADLTWTIFDDADFNLDHFKESWTIFEV